MNMFENVLDKTPAISYYLNMFNKRATRAKSKETRSTILNHAIGRFREKGFDATTMRDVAEAADVALGAAYYYFPSKEAIVQAYYDDVQAEHARRVTEALAEQGHGLHERLRIAFHAKFDILANDRKLLGALFRYSADPDSPLSVFGPSSGAVREASLSVFALAIGGEKLPDDIRAILPSALWAAHMGILLYFIYDQSPDQVRSRKLIDSVTLLIVRILALAKMPILKPLRGSLMSLLRDAEFFPIANPQRAVAPEER